MELTPRYKQTEIGPIPEAWEAETIGNIASFTSGKGISVAALRRRSSDNPVPVFGGNGLAGFTQKALVRDRTVVVGRVGQKCGEVYLTDGPAWITDNALFPRRMHRECDIAFLGLALRGAGLNDVKNRNDLPLVTQSILHSVRVAWPASVSEQRAIVATLGDVDLLIDALNELIAKKRDLKQATMQQLLTGRTRLPKFRKKWEVRKLAQLGEFLKGRGVTRGQAQGGSLACVRYGEIYTTHQDVIRQFTSWISPATALTATRLRQGDILFAGSGETKAEIGKCVAFVGDFEAYAGGDIVILRPRDANSVFLAYALNMPFMSDQKASRGQGDAVVHISAAALAGLEIAVPTRAEQTAIAAVLSDFDAELAALEARHDKTRALKQGMMQELLTGRIRLL